MGRKEISHYNIWSRVSLVTTVHWLFHFTEFHPYQNMPMAVVESTLIMITNLLRHHPPSPSPKFLHNDYNTKTLVVGSKWKLNFLWCQWYVYSIPFVHTEIAGTLRDWSRVESYSYIHYWPQNCRVQKFNYVQVVVINSKSSPATYLQTSVKAILIRLY